MALESWLAAPRGACGKLRRVAEFDVIAEARRQWAGRWGGDAASPMTAVTSIMRVQQILMARLNELLRPLEVTFPRYEALMLLYLSSRGSLPLGKIGDRIDALLSDGQLTPEQGDALTVLVRERHDAIEPREVTDVA